MARLSPEDRQVLDDYITKTHLAAQDEGEYLYIQGIKDSVKLMKKLEIL